MLVFLFYRSEAHGREKVYLTVGRTTRELTNGKIIKGVGSRGRELGSERLTGEIKIMGQNWRGQEMINLTRKPVYDRQLFSIIKF